MVRIVCALLAARLAGALQTDALKQDCDAGLALHAEQLANVQSGVLVGPALAEAKRSAVSITGYMTIPLAGSRMHGNAEAWEPIFFEMRNETVEEKKKRAKKKKKNGKAQVETRKRDIATWTVIVDIVAQRDWSEAPTLLVAWQCAGGPVERKRVPNTAENQKFECRPQTWSTDSRPSCVTFTVRARVDAQCKVLVLRNDREQVTDLFESELRTCGQSEHCCRAPDGRASCAPAERKKSASWARAAARLLPARTRGVHCAQVGNAHCAAMPLLEAGTPLALAVRRAGPPQGLESSPTRFPPPRGCPEEHRCCAWQDDVRVFNKGVGPEEGLTTYKEITDNILNMESYNWNEVQGRERVAAAVARAGGHGGQAKLIMIPTSGSGFGQADEAWHACIHAQSCPEIPSPHPWDKKYGSGKNLKGKITNTKYCREWPEFTSTGAVDKAKLRKDNSDKERAGQKRDM